MEDVHPGQGLEIDWWPPSKEAMANARVLKKGSGATDVAAFFTVSEGTVYMWLARFRLEGAGNLADPPSQLRGQFRKAAFARQ